MTTIALPLTNTRSWPMVAAGAGLVLGFVYTLSPLTVLSLAVLAWAIVAASRGLSVNERRWYWCLLSVAIVIRLVTIALLFLSADPSRPFNSFFGDEEFYKLRTVWVRNVGEGLAMSPADIIYSFDAVGRTSYIYVLAFIQSVVGDAPYGLHMLNMTMYVVSVLALYRFVRRPFGGVVAMAGLMALLLLPTLLMWSISVLKEPMNVFMLVAELLCAAAVALAPRWWQRVLAAIGVLGFGLAMESLREGGLLTASIGTVGGLSLAFILARGRRLVATVALVPAAVTVLLLTPAIQERVLAQLRNVALYHSGHVVTPGYAYQLLDPYYYFKRYDILEMPAGKTVEFAGKAIWSYFAEPAPWRLASPALLAYMPEQLLWYVMALLLPIGVVAGLRRHRVITSLLVAHAGAAILLVALTSGNIGTLIRHRSLAMLYIVWLSALGAHECVRRVIEGRQVRREGSSGDGDR